MSKLNKVFKYISVTLTTIIFLSFAYGLFFENNANLKIRTVFPISFGYPD